MQDDDNSALSDREVRPERRRRARISYDDRSEGYGPAGYGYGTPGAGAGLPGGGAGGGGLGGRSLIDYLNWLLRYGWLIVLTTVGGTVTGYHLFSITPKTYLSWATIEIQRLKQEAAEVSEEEKVRLSGSAEIHATLEKLRLPRIYESVAVNPKLQNRPEMMPEVRRFVLPWKLREKAAEAEEPKAAPSPELLAAMMPGWIRVSVRPNTNLVDVYSTHTDPVVARDVLQILLEEFESMTAETIAGSEQYTIGYIVEKSQELQGKALQLEKAIARYQGCLDLSQSIHEADASVIEMEKRYLPKWPDLMEAKELIGILRTRFTAELERTIRGSAEEQAFWQEHAKELEKLGGDELVDAQLKLVASRATILRSNFESDQGILKELTMKLKQADVTRGYDATQFAIVQKPTLPSAPVAPSMKSIVGKYGAGGLMLGVGFVLLIGFLDPSIRTVAELETQSRLPVIGAVPALAPGRKEMKRELVLMTESDNHASEAIRTVRSGLSYLGDGEERRTFVFTSALPGEGKSWASANVAVAFAQQGERTVLVDADLRKSVQSSTFDMERELPGMSDYLSRKADFGQVCHRSVVDNLWVLPSGVRTPNPAELLGSRNLEVLMRELSQNFDRVIIDSAPLVPVSDTLSITKWAQSVVLIYKMGKTPRTALLRALKSLRARKCEPVGIIANLLPRVSRRGAYGYYYSYAGGGVQGYYGDGRKDKG